MSVTSGDGVQKPALLDKVKRRIEGEESGLSEWIQCIYLFYIRIAEIIG